ncbi:fucose isomerase [Singulisphaera acidiphila]|uniref:L-fucose isomerase family protein n=1 Tax=Singulisphaera acidiphila (strain ATCC BAA-1392 / DSM 18658 / VKM B-2454 / MOB10) TaxID=886293 RepID=L0DKL8_SINAD|nr:fucose isomerase [Singulisphaera acidiphila]AGA29216.1 L-fucose isomerase family protein [Singulisphaera acidiphila DSM 18658]
MSKKVAVFWPGDYRAKPNEWALPQSQETTGQLVAALKKLGRTPYVVEGYLTRPDQSIAKLGPIDDPMVGVYVHWTYAPHTVDGVVGKDNPLLLASNFSGTWPGLVALLNTGASLESVGRASSRVWTDAPDWTADAGFMERLDEWCTTGRITYDSGEIHDGPAVAADAAAISEQVLAEIRRKRILALMLGDTSMGMINGYFGPRLLYPIGFSEHKVDQAWLIERTKQVSQQRVDDAFQFVQDRGVTFHWGAQDATDFTADSTREQLRGYLAVLDLLDEFQADCLGWQYQLGLLKLLPPSDFAEGLLNSHARPEGNGHVVITSTEADQGNLVPMELMKRVLEAKGLAGSVMFHDVRWGAEHEGRWLWVLLNSGSCGAYAFNQDVSSLNGVHSYRQPAGYFPVAGGTFAGESLPGPITWARTWIDRQGELVMDLGRGESVSLPNDVREAWWGGTTRQWPFMAADLGCSKETIMAHYMSNHIAVAYGDIFSEMVALSRSLGFKIRVLSTGQPA